MPNVSNRINTVKYKVFFQTKPHSEKCITDTQYSQTPLPCHEMDQMFCVIINNWCSNSGV